MVVFYFYFFIFSRILFLATQKVYKKFRNCRLLTLGGTIFHTKKESMSITSFVVSVIPYRLTDHVSVY